jgi:hypothetical protein
MSFDPARVADGIWLGVSVMASAAAFQYIFLPALVDGLRDRLFEIRRDLFVLVMNGDLAPTDMSYVSLRRSLNGFIRYAERITFIRGFVAPIAAMFAMPSSSAVSYRSRRRVADIHDFSGVSNPELQARLRALHDRMATAVVLHVFISSPIAWALTLIMLPFVVLYALIAGTADTLKSHVVAEVSDRAECDVDALMAAA